MSAARDSSVGRLFARREADLQADGSRTFPAALILNRMPRGPSLRERLDKQALDKLYTRDGLSTVQIARRFGTQSASVLKLMAEYGIARRSRGAGKT